MKQKECDCMYSGYTGSLFKLMLLNNTVFCHLGFIRISHSTVKCVMCVQTNDLREITNVAQIQVMMNAASAWR